MFGGCGHATACIFEISIERGSWVRAIMKHRFLRQPIGKGLGHCRPDQSQKKPIGDKIIKKSSNRQDTSVGENILVT